MPSGSGVKKMSKTVYRKAFITGSHAYGIPHKDSDIDLVVLLTQEDLAKLEIGCDPPKDEDEENRQAYITAGGMPLRFGKLNLIATTEPAQFEIWKRGTRALKKQAPVSRAFAVKFFRILRAKAGYSV